MSFGRKGLAPGESAPVLPRPVVPGQGHADARRAAFLPAQGARNTAASGSLAGSSDPSADPLAGLRNGVRPATRRDDAVGESWSPMPEQQGRAVTQGRDGVGRGRGGSGKRFIFGEPHKRTLVLAYLFWFIAGQGSLHRFYCGQSQSAITQIGVLFGSVLFGLVFTPIAVVGIFAWFFWILADLFLMPGMMRRFKAEYAPDYSGVFA